MGEFCTTEMDGNLLLITLNRPDRLNALQVDLGFHEYTQPFTGKSKLDVTCITFALMAGTAGLPHVIVRFYTTPNVRAARWSAAWACASAGSAA